MSESNYDISGLEEDIEEDIIYGFIGAFLYALYAIFLIFALFLNGNRVYSDLFTQDRKALDHRRSKPIITGTYSLILLLTEASVFFWLLMVIFMLSTYIFARTAIDCTTLQILAGSSGEIGYITLYLIFLARLHWLYSESKFAVNISLLILSGISITIFGIVIIYSMITIWVSNVYFYGGHAFPNYCDGTLEPVTGTLALVQDVVFSFAFLYAFYKPLKETVLLVNNNNDNRNMDNNVIVKIRYSGTKTLVLTLVSTFATGILILTTVITDLNFIIGFDSIMHTICILLMTPHYNDKLWYQRLCCLCLNCPGIDQSHLNYDDQKQLDSHSNIKHDKDQALLSVDTFSQLRITGKQLLMNYNPDAPVDNPVVDDPIDNPIDNPIDDDDDVQIQMKDNVIVQSNDDDDN